eukprot:TRINITY_DN793_c4_g1_i1.p1 TRINITY_DN793_c4_g1~~TRINITY_DN793_c4_g1_i1.p1  ORF type:complete len:408 (+),score=88.96 TRINITY_DN793_c4_g1_i1:85-1308(+)
MGESRSESPEASPATAPGMGASRLGWFSPCADAGAKALVPAPAAPLAPPPLPRRPARSAPPGRRELRAAARPGLYASGDPARRGIFCLSAPTPQGTPWSELAASLRSPLPTLQTPAPPRPRPATAPSGRHGPPRGGVKGRGRPSGWEEVLRDAECRLAAFPDYVPRGGLARQAARAQPRDWQVPGQLRPHLTPSDGARGERAERAQRRRRQEWLRRAAEAQGYGERPPSSVPAAGVRGAVAALATARQADPTAGIGGVSYRRMSTPHAPTPTPPPTPPRKSVVEGEKRRLTKLLGLSIVASLIPAKRAEMEAEEQEKFESDLQQLVPSYVAPGGREGGARTPGSPTGKGLRGGRAQQPLLTPQGPDTPTSGSKLSRGGGRSGSPAPHPRSGSPAPQSPRSARAQRRK